MVSRTIPRLAGFMYRENRVPYYQRLFQNNDGKRQWWKSSRSKFFIIPFYASMYTATFATMYAMGRTVLGYKSWYGE